MMTTLLWTLYIHYAMSPFFSITQGPQILEGPELSDCDRMGRDKLPF